MRANVAVICAAAWTALWILGGTPIAIWYGPPVNPALNSGVVVVSDHICFGFEITGHPGAFGGCE